MRIARHPPKKRECGHTANMRHRARLACFPRLSSPDYLCDATGAPDSGMVVFEAMTPRWHAGIA
jgi:hypothetical protein